MKPIKIKSPGFLEGKPGLYAYIASRLLDGVWREDRVIVE